MERAVAAVCLLLWAGTPCLAGRGEITASELMELLPSMAADAPEPPAVTEAELVELEEGDPETYIFIHGTGAHPPAPVNMGGDGRLSLTRPDLRAQVSAVYRKSDGSYDQGEIARIERLMRCSRTGKQTPVSVKLLEILDAVEDKFGGRGLTVLSGYRSPRFNKALPGAARWSLHMLGWAADIRVPGRGAAEVADFAGKLGGGGVGYYPDAAFVHLDSGRPRSWQVKRKPRAKPPARKK